MELASKDSQLPRFYQGRNREAEGQLEDGPYDYTLPFGRYDKALVILGALCEEIGNQPFSVRRPAI